MTKKSQQHPSKSQRILLHLRCPWRNWQEARFHLAGIFREFGIDVM
jgi:hypothetical protein